MNINIQSIKVRDYEYSYANGYTYKWKDPIDQNYIPEKDFDTLKKDLKGKIYQKLLPTDKVFFSQFSEFPRHKFRQYYKNPIVKKMESADAVIVNPDQLYKGYQWCSTYYQLSDGTYGTQSYIKDKSLTYTGNSLVGYTSLISPEINFAKLLSTQKLVCDKDFLEDINSDGADLDESELDSIRDFLKSPNKDDVKIGMNMLSTLDYGKYGYKIAYLLASVKNNLYSTRYIPNRACKYIMESLDKEYNWRNYTDIEFGKKLMISKDAEKVEFSKKIIKNYVEDIVKNDTFVVSIDFKIK